MGIGGGDVDSSTTLQGGTDGTKIGNVSDALKVVTQPISAVTTVPSWSKTLRYDDMNVANGGVARATSIPNSASWTTIYSYTGSGYVAGIIVNVETFSTGWEFRLVVDSTTIFSLLDTDLTGDAIYDVDDITDVNQAYLGLSKGSHDRFLWHAPMNAPVYYATQVQVQLRRQAGAKKFQAGLVVLSKET
jgi:hypothetical protein